MTPALVIGLGHPDRGDDALGLLVAGRVRALGCLPVVTGLADPGALLAAWAGCERVVVVDAVVDGQPPGTWVRLELGDRRLADRRISLHGAALVTAVALGHALQMLPRSVTLCGVSAAEFRLGQAMHPAVAAAVEPLAQAIADEFQAAHADGR